MKYQYREETKILKNIKKQMLNLCDMINDDEQYGEYSDVDFIFGCLLAFSTVIIMLPIPSTTLFTERTLSYQKKILEGLDK